MGASELARGKRAELAVVAALRRAGWRAATTRAVQGRQGGFDIDTDAPVAIEVKDHAAIDLSGWLRQAQAQAAGRLPVVWHKRRGRAAAEEWYVTMDGATFLALLGRGR